MYKKEALPVIPSKDMFAGPVDAPVELTVYGDYESSETRQLNEVMKEMMKIFNGKNKMDLSSLPPNANSPKSTQGCRSRH
jgi:hypothetical protein